MKMKDLTIKQLKYRFREHDHAIKMNCFGSNDVIGKILCESELERRGIGVIEKTTITFKKLKRNKGLICPKKKRFQ